MVKSTAGSWRGQEHVVMNVSRFNHVRFSFPVFTGDGTEERRTTSAPDALAENPNVKGHHDQTSTQ